MRLPSFRLKTLIITVAIVAACLAWLARPYPVNLQLGGGLCRITWSNSSVTEEKLAPPLWRPARLPRRWRHRVLLIAVDWTDGTTSWHLQVPYKDQWIWWNATESGY